MKEKYIETRFSKKKGQEGRVSAYLIHIKIAGKTYCETFKVSDYKTVSACLKAAIRRRDEKISELRELPKSQIVKSYTVQEVYDAFPKYFKLSKQSYIKYDKAFNKYIKEKNASKKMSEVDSADVLDSLATCAEHCVQTHVNHLKTVWHRIFQTAIQMGLRVTDWTVVIQVPKSNTISERKLKEQNITQEDFEAFITFMAQYGQYADEDEKAIYNRTVMCYCLRLMRITGMRPQECKAIKREFVQFGSIPYKRGREEIALITVAHSIGSTLTENVTIKNTKTPQSVRILPIGGRGVDLMKEILAYTRYDLIFADYDGNPISSTKLSDYCRRVRKAYERQTGKKLDFYPLLLRKSFSADCWRTTSDPKTVMAAMGHNNASTSLEHYASASMEMIYEAIKDRQYKSGSVDFMDGFIPDLSANNSANDSK